MEDLEDEITVLEKELLNLKKTWLKLVKIKDSVNAKMLVPGPISFKEYENNVKKGFAGSLARTRSRERTLECRLHQLCGINFIEETEKENEREEDSEHSSLNREVYNVELSFAAGSTIYSGYSVKLKRVEDGMYEVENYHLPYGMESDLVKNKTMSGFEDVILFLKVLRRCGNALFDRRRQMQEFINFCERHDIDVDVTTSYHRRHTEITLKSDVIMKTKNPINVTFTLKYNSDSFLPVEVTYEEKDFIEKEKTHLNYCMSEFLTLQLKKGFINMLNNKEIKCESSDESLVSSKEKSVVESVETRQEGKLGPSRSQSGKEQENKEKNISEGGSTASMVESVISDKEERGSFKQHLVKAQPKNISPNQMRNSADEQHISTTKQNDSNDVRIETMNKQQEDQCDLVITDLSSIVNSDEALPKHLQRQRTTKTLVSSTPLSRIKSAMIYGADAKKLIEDNKIHLRRHTRLTDAYYQRNIQEFMKRNENSQTENSPSISPEKKFHKPGANADEHERDENKQTLDTPASVAHVSFNVQEKKVPHKVHRDTPLVQSSKRKRRKK